MRWLYKNEQEKLKKKIIKKGKDRGEENNLKPETMPRRARSAGWCRTEQSELRLGTVRGKQSSCTVFYLFETSNRKQPWCEPGSQSFKCWKALRVFSTQHFAGGTHHFSGAHLTEGPFCFCSSRFSCLGFPSAGPEEMGTASAKPPHLLGWISSSTSKAAQH